MTDVYVTDVTAEVQDVVHKSARWLNANILEGTYKPNNVFFSGSFKGNSVSPLLQILQKVDSFGHLGNELV